MPEGTSPLASVAWPVYREIEVLRSRDGRQSQTRDRVAEEAPVALLYGGVPYVVMLATPADLEDLAVGFTMSEALVSSADEIRAFHIAGTADQPEIHLTIAPERFASLLGRQRNLTGRTGCGLCGAETVADAIRQPAAVKTMLRVSSADLRGALGSLPAHQRINAVTGSVHAAAWVVPGAGIQLVREDVGRHNALDKLLGALVRGDANFGAGYVLITSRASYEMVQKVATLGIGVLVAVSAPTALAIRLAEASNLCLVGFARENNHVVYAHGERIVA
jgi:FdhD protein